MSRQCYAPLESATEGIDLSEVDPLPTQDNIEMLKNGKALYDNYYQSIRRMFIDYKTADVFSSLNSKQNDLQSLYINIWRSFSLIANPELQDIREITNNWNYELRDKKEIIRYLYNHSELLPIIEQVPFIIDSYFKNSELALEIQKDPEEESEILMIYIKTSLSAVKAYKKLDELDENWWLEIAKEIGSSLCLHVEFQ